MKIKSVRILAGILLSAVAFTGCGSNDATKAVSESLETEKEGISQNEEELELLKPTEEPEPTEIPEEETSEETDDTQETEPAAKVGILVPKKEQEDRWTENEKLLCQNLEEYGYEPFVYRADSSEEQKSQITAALNQEAAALIITPVQAYELDEVLQQVLEASIPVFSYDELIMDTDAVNYYITYSERSAGNKIGETIIQKMGLEDARKNGESRNIEFFMGSPDDLDALFFYNGLMEKLQEYMDDGTLVCPSGKTAFSDVAVMDGNQNAARRELLKRLETNYADGTRLDIVCTGLDSLAAGAVEALLENQLVPGSEDWPFISGTGCEAEAVKSIARGKQAVSLFMDSRNLAQECAKLVDACLKEETPEVNDYETYDNGKKIVGTVTCEMQVIDADNYPILIDNGYYEEEEIEPEPMEPEMTEVPEPESIQAEPEAPEETQTGEDGPENTETEAADPENTDSGPRLRL